MGKAMVFKIIDAGSSPAACSVRLIIILLSSKGRAMTFEVKGYRFKSYRGRRLVAERFIALVLKTKDLGPWVQIPPSPNAC